MRFVAIRVRRISDFVVRGTHTVCVERLMASLVNGEAKDHFNTNEIIVVTPETLAHAKAELAAKLFTYVRDVFIPKFCTGDAKVHQNSIDPRDICFSSSYFEIDTDYAPDILRPTVLEDIYADYPAKPECGEIL